MELYPLPSATSRSIIRSFLWAFAGHGIIRHYIEVAGKLDTREELRDGILCYTIVIAHANSDVGVARTIGAVGNRIVPDQIVPAGKHDSTTRRQGANLDRIVRECAVVDGAGDAEYSADRALIHHDVFRT
jgi:hypothetical protein